MIFVGILRLVPLMVRTRVLSFPDSTVDRDQLPVIMCWIEGHLKRLDLSLQTV